MSYCLNIACQNPQNPNGIKFCESCGAKLLLGDRYQPLQQIGQGGFGRTFLAIDEYKPSKPRCVIKQFFPQIQGNNHTQKIAELFEQEAIRLDELGKHPQIPELLAHFAENNCQYLVQEFIEGQNLADQLAEKGCFTENQIIHLLTNLLPVLQFIHNQQVIHRDIKPENIIQRRPSPSPAPTLVAPIQGEAESTLAIAKKSDFPATSGKVGELVLVDFGASKFAPRTALSVTGTIIGSAGYTAPEQAAGKAVFASDIYSLGVTCIHLLTQNDPFDLYSFDEGTWTWQDAVKNPVSEALRSLLNKMLEGATKLRYQSVAEVLYDLQFLINSSSSSTSPIVDPHSPLILTPKPEIIVAKIGSAHYKTIREAIKNAEPDTRILVRPGFYREGLILNKSLEIIGDGEQNDIIIESKCQPCLIMQTDQAWVRGLTLHYQDWTQLKKANTLGRRVGELWLKPYAISIPQGQLILEKCTITSTGIAGIHIYGTNTQPHIIACKIQEGSDYGILVDHQGQGRIEDCDISGDHIGVKIIHGGNPTLRNCQIHHIQGNGILIGSSSEGLLENCSIFGNTKTGVLIKKGGNATIRQCQINRNQEQGIYVESNGAGPIENCDLTGNLQGAWFIAPQCSVRRSGNKEFS